MRLRSSAVLALLMVLVAAATASVSSADETVLEADPNGYLTFCPCMGKSELLRLY